MSGITPILLDAKASATFLGVSLRTFRDLIKSESFPEPRALGGPRSTRWVRSELEEYAKALPPIRQREEPAQLAAARAAKGAGLAILPAPFSHAP